MTSSGIEPATFRIVAQHLNHCVTAVPTSKDGTIWKWCERMWSWPETGPIAWKDREKPFSVPSFEPEASWIRKPAPSRRLTVWWTQEKPGKGGQIWIYATQNRWPMGRWRQDSLVHLCYQQSCQKWNPVVPESFSDPEKVWQRGNRKWSK